MNNMTPRDPRCPIKREEEKEDAFCLEWFDDSNDLKTIENRNRFVDRERVSIGGLVDERIIYWKTRNVKSKLRKTDN